MSGKCRVRVGQVPYEQGSSAPQVGAKPHLPGGGAGRSPVKQNCYDFVNF